MQELTEFENSILLEQFDRFYREIIRNKAVATEPGSGFTPTPARIPKAEIDPEAYPAPYDDTATRTALEGADAALTLKRDAEPSSIDSHRPGESGDVILFYQAIHADLSRMLSEQVPESRKYGGEYGVTYYREAQYIMAALADEIFLSIDWSGRERWRSDLLEMKFFGSYTAGDTIFEKVERLLKGRDPADKELAAIYLMAFSLGFRGRYQAMDDGGRIDLHRKQLFHFIANRNPNLHRAGERLLAPAAYEATLTGAEERSLPHPRRWLWVILLVVVIFLIVSHLIWNYQISDLERVVNDLMTTFGARN